MSQTHKILDVGCGKQKFPGAVGIDRVANPGVDVIHNLNRFPCPFQNNTFDEVRMNHIIEYLEDILKIMAEIHRICRPGGRVLIWTPHYSSMNSWTDPTHRQHLAYHSMDLFTEDARYIYTSVHFQVIEKQITFGPALICWPGRIIAYLNPDKFEKYFAFVFPARDLYFHLKVTK
jgi:SAM-dependent methyltransferase